MYNLTQIRRVGLIHSGGGVVVAVAGFVAQLFAPGNSWADALVSCLLNFVIFGVGWSLFNQFVMGQILINLKKGVTFNNQPLKCLKTLPKSPSRLGLDYQAFEFLAMLLASGLVAVMTLLVSTGSGFSLGGFAGGWLIGGGFGRWRFGRKAQVEEREQERTFYFSDATIGPRTDLAFYELKPGKRTLAEVNAPDKLVKTTLETALPPGVRRRVGNEAKPGGSVRKRAKAVPLISTPQTQSKNPSPTHPKEK